MERTWTAKTRVKTDIIEFFFQEDSSMDLASRMIWRFGCPMKLDTSRFSVKSQSPVLHFCHLTSFSKETKETNFSVKSSWEVRWIIMFQKDVVCDSAVVTKNKKHQDIHIRLIAQTSAHYRSCLHLMIRFWGEKNNLWSKRSVGCRSKTNYQT